MIFLNFLKHFVKPNKYQSIDPKHVTTIKDVNCSSSVTRLVDFWNFLTPNFLTNVAKIFGDFLGWNEKQNFQVKTVVATFKQFLLTNLATFYSNIWSHCARRRLNKFWMCVFPFFSLHEQLLLYYYYHHQTFQTCCDETLISLILPTRLPACLLFRQLLQPHLSLAE